MGALETVRLITKVAISTILFVPRDMIIKHIVRKVYIRGITLERRQAIFLPCKLISAVGPFPNMVRITPTRYSVVMRESIYIHNQFTHNKIYIQIKTIT